MNTTGIWCDKLRLSGKPCIRPTRFSVSQMLAELASGESLKGIAENFEIDYNNIVEAWIDMVNELCILKINSQYIISGGVNCLRGYEIPVSLVLMDFLTDNLLPKQEAKNRDLEQEKVEGMLWNLAALLDRDWTNGPPENIEKAIEEGPA